MKARILPPAEWPRLNGTEAEDLWPHLIPENARVIVVEEDGEIVGTWTALRLVHMECLWVAPKHRGSFGVAKRLLRKMGEVAAAWGAEKIITGSMSEHVTSLIFRLGGEPTPGMSFVLPVNVSFSRKVVDRELGRAFHQQLAGLVDEGLEANGEHLDNPADDHNEQVGRALRTAIRDREPVLAMEQYNAWAHGAGYEAVRYLGVFDGRMRADMGDAVIDVDDSYVVTLVKQERVCQSE